MQPLRVVDGDTIVVNIDLGFHLYTEEYVRLAGVDTPEIFGKYAEEKGKLAKLFVGMWINNNERGYFNKDLIHYDQVIESMYRTAQYTWGWEDGLHLFYLKSDKYDQRGKYGRVIGTIYRMGDPVSLNQALIDNGLEKEIK
ncbi:MAG: thermonuclease family protein [Candidatus Hodarchaeales archaeon]|jgi:micrococcal nuclease